MADDRRFFLDGIRHDPAALLLYAEWQTERGELSRAPPPPLPPTPALPPPVPSAWPQPDLYSRLMAAGMGEAVMLVLIVTATVAAILCMKPPPN